MTLEEIFSLDNFNVIEDTNNYYFFRALNKGDNNDIESGITLDSNSKIERVRTDRERYVGTPRYNEDSKISLQEMHDHIKMHHSIDTNCISLTSNANAAVIYGRGYYQDKYIMVKVPKNELGDKVVNAGLYMMQEIEKIIDNYISNNELDSETVSYLQSIKNATTQEELLSILQVNNIEELTDNKEIPTNADNMFQKGIIYKVTKSINAYYKALNDVQNLEKNKLIAKINLLNKRILPNVNNTFLIQTIGNAFSALELIHYGDITQEQLIDIPKEIVDIFALLQQLPKDYPYINEIKQELLKALNTGNINVPSYQDKKLNIEDDYTIEKMYQLTGGHIDYETSTETYKKSFFLAKSKLRTLNMVNTLNSLLGNNPKYHDTLRYILNNTYGVEPEIAFRHSSNTLQISESISLDFEKEEKELFDLINGLNTNDLQTITNNPLGTLQYLLKNLSYIKENPKDQETYYANAVIDLFDWSKLDIVEFYPSQRNDLVKKLKENHCLELYNLLKERGVKEKDIANTLLTIAIKQKDLSSIDLKDTFTTDELEQFLGYYRINATEINLRNYQATALKNIDKTFQKKQFVSAILPTGAGKSFVALAEMLEHKDKEILYLAPNDSILEQIENYIVKYIHGETVTKSKKVIIKEVFPNLKLQTYYGLSTINQQEYINHKYDLIVFDELHRSGAPDWKRKVEELLQNQDNNVRVLGITATPQRDVDMIDMAEYWARYYGYTEEEISNHEHMAINMDLVDAIKLGYVVNPKVVNCEYTLKDGELIENLLEKINLVKDEDKKNELLTKFERLRRSLDQAEGIEQVFTNNIKKGGKYIVFCPVTNQKGQVVEDEDGILNDSRITGQDVIDKYTKQIGEYLKNSDLDIEFYSMLGAKGYSKGRNSKELSNFSIDEPDKTKFIVVMNKLNEGVHVKDIDGIIWFRPLDENSKILYLQQLGRIIYGIDPNNEYPDEKRPIAIDLVNNTLRVNMQKNKALDTNDLDLLHVVCDWIKEHDNKIPDINSSNKIESRYASILKRIQEKYSCYLDNPELLNNLESSKLKEVQAILELGMTIDLWGILIPEKIKTTTTKEQTIEIEPFEVSEILRDFCELDVEVDKNIISLSFEDKLKEVCEYLDTNSKLPSIQSGIKFSDYINMGNWINNYSNNGKIKEYAIKGNKYALKIINFQNSKESYEVKFERHLEELYEYLDKHGKLPSKELGILFSDGSNIYNWWCNKTNQDKLEKYVYAGNKYAIIVNDYIKEHTQIYEEKFKNRLKEVYEYLDKCGYLPEHELGVNFSDGVNMYDWVRKLRTKYIRMFEEYVASGNEYAIAIKKNMTSNEEKTKTHLKELYEYLDKHGNLPSEESGAKFDDNVKMWNWWRKRKQNHKFEQYASDGNEYAIAIMNYFNSKKAKFDETKETFEKESTFKKVEGSIGKEKPKEDKKNKGEEVSGRKI